jgi:hypothetical protein
MLKLIFILPFLFSNPSAPNEDWGATGHRVVGEVAAQHISKKTAKAIDRLLDGVSLAYVSYYADEIKSDDRYRAYSPWHYANLDLDETYNTSEKNPKGDLVQAIEKCVAVLKNNKASKAEPSVSSQTFGSFHWRPSPTHAFGKKRRPRGK